MARALVMLPDGDRGFLNAGFLLRSLIRAREQTGLLGACIIATPHTLGGSRGVGDLATAIDQFIDGRKPRAAPIFWCVSRPSTRSKQGSPPPERDVAVHGGRVERATTGSRCCLPASDSRCWRRYL